jgi:hypothetical protein
MFSKLFKIQWKGAVRSTMWARNVAANIFMGFALLILALNLVSIGLFIDVIFEKAAPGIDPVGLINSYLIYYFIFDIIFRLLLQKKHGIIVKPLLLLPLSRSSLVHYVLAKSFYSIFNFLPLFVIIPFAVKVVSVNYGGTAALSWLLYFIALVLCNSFIVTYIKRAAEASFKYAVYSGIAGMAVFLMDKFNLLPFSDISAALFSLPLENPIYVLLTLLILTLIYFINFSFLRNILYTDNLQQKVSRRTGSSTILQKIEDMGEVGKYIALELKLLYRNKRSKSTIYLSVAMILFGIIVYPAYTRDDKFPQPLAEHEKFIAEYEKDAAGLPDARKVTFKVLPKLVPEEATLFIAGNHALLRNWKADGLPLSMNPDSSWSRSVYFNEGTALKYKITLGSWGRQRLLADGTTPADYELVISNDTTVVLTADAWDTPPFKTFSSIFLIYMGIIIVGIFLISYGQFIFGWESSYFDSILANPVNYISYFRAKLYLMVISCTLFYILTLGYAYFGTQVLLVNTAVFFYNIGVNTYVLFFLACLNRKRLDLDASIMSTQGKGAGQYLTIVPTLLLPTIIFVPFAIYDSSRLGLIVLTVLGIAGLIFQKPIMKLIIAFFYKNKYKLATAFRIH